MYKKRHLTVYTVLIWWFIAIGLAVIAIFAPALGLCPGVFDGKGLRRIHVLGTGCVAGVFAIWQTYWHFLRDRQVFSEFHERTRPLQKNLSALGIGCFVAFFMLEIFLNLYNPFGFRLRGNKIRLEARKRTEIMNNVNPQLNSKIIHTTNMLGFRGDDPPLNFQDYLTIITVGGSTTECFYLSDGKTWTDVLGGKLAQTFKRLWVNNAGLDGHSTYGHLVLMEDYILNIQPKVVIFMVGANDVGLLKERPEFDGTIKGNQQHSAVKTFRTKAVQLFTKVSEYSMVAAAGLNFYRYHEAKQRGLTHFSTSFLHSASPYVLSSQSSQPETDALTVEQIKQQHRDLYLSGYAARLQELIRMTRTRQIEPVLVTQPALFSHSSHEKQPSENASEHPGVIYGVNGSAAWEILELYNDVTRQVAQREEVLLIDLANELPPERRYFYDLIHFSNEGAAQVAAILEFHLCSFLSQQYGSFMKGSCPAKPSA